MSVHLFVAAAYLEDLDPSVKLVLMAVADSADEHTLEAAPGLPKLRAWSGRSKSQVTRIVGDLEAAGYIARIAPGRLGRRAVYRVFPNGVPAIPHPDEVRDRFVVPNVDNAESFPQDDDGEGRMGAPHRGAYPADRGAPMRPLQSSTSVTRAEPASKLSTTGSGFPGARPPAEAEAGATKRARGGHDQPCPLHPEQVHPCRRCAHEATKTDPATRATALEQARAQLAARRTTTANPEEKSA